MRKLREKKHSVQFPRERTLKHVQQPTRNYCRAITWSGSSAHTKFHPTFVSRLAAHRASIGLRIVEQLSFALRGYHHFN